MEAVSLYEKDYSIEVEHIDYQGNLKLSSLFIFLQDVAGLHAVNLGMGREVLYKNYGVVWVLARIRVDISQYPKWQDKVIIETWPQEPTRLGFDRDFLVKDEKGNILARAVSTWALIELKSRKLKKPGAVFTGYPPTIKERSIDCRLGGLRPGDQLEDLYKRTVRYSDVDVNEHLNNSRYADLIMDCFPICFHKEYDLTSIEINYSKEALPGEEIAILKDKGGTHKDTYIEGLNKSGGKLIFKSRVKFRKK